MQILHHLPPGAGRASGGCSQQSPHLDVRQRRVAPRLAPDSTCPVGEIEAEQLRRRGAPFLRSAGVGDDFYVMPINEVQHESKPVGADDLAEVLKWCGRRIARDLWEQAAAGTPAGCGSGRRAGSLSAGS
jgi:hypothetical protein